VRFIALRLPLIRETVSGWIWTREQSDRGSNPSSGVLVDQHSRAVRFIWTV